jgi:hypothetical protein
MPRFMGNGSGGLVSSTCFAHFNTPCAMSNILSLVDHVVLDLEKGLVGDVLHAVDGQKYSERVNFWPNVLQNGTFLASGLVRTVHLAGSGAPNGSSYSGRSVAEVMLSESGLPQRGLWERMVHAADGDGHFEFIGWDNFHTQNQPPYAVKRLGYARWARTSQGSFIVTAALSDKPLSNQLTRQPCDSSVDALCSVTYTRRILGAATSALLTAASPAELEAVFASIIWRQFNQYGFYPFVYEFDGTCVAHGANSGLVGRKLPAIIAGVSRLRDIVNGDALQESLSQAARNGGGWASYYWTNSERSPAYLKVSYTVGVSRFGRDYFIGVGLNYMMRPRKLGPRCSTCISDFNYPCAWATALGLLGHAQTLLLMADRYDEGVAFQMLSSSAEFQLVGGFYPFLYDFNGTCVAHYLPGVVGRTLWEIVTTQPALAGGSVDGRMLHELFVAAAQQGGGWVAYEWISMATLPQLIESKLSYVVQINRGGRSYYLGVGIGDRPWPTSPCSQRFGSPCSEDAAVSLAGSLISSIVKEQQGLGPTDKIDTAALQRHSVLSTLPGAAPFAAHVQMADLVVADGWNGSFVGMPAVDWYLKVGVPYGYFTSVDPYGAWLGPVLMSPDGQSPAEAHLLLFTTVSSYDQFDGSDNSFSIIVAVRDMPMPLSPPYNSSCQAAVPCDGTIAGDSMSACAKVDPEDTAVCRCDAGFTIEQSPLSLPPLPATCTGAQLQLQATYSMRCQGVKARMPPESNGLLELIVGVTIALCLVSLLLVLAYSWYHRRDQGLLRLQECPPPGHPSTLPAHGLLALF